MSSFYGSSPNKGEDLKNGGTINGDLNITGKYSQEGTPTEDKDLATKKYVDNITENKQDKLVQRDIGVQIIKQGYYATAKSSTDETYNETSNETYTYYYYDFCPVNCTNIITDFAGDDTIPSLITIETLSDGTYKTTEHRNYTNGVFEVSDGTTNLALVMNAKNDETHFSVTTTYPLDDLYVIAGLKDGEHIGYRATAEGDGTVSSGYATHAEGYETTVTAQTAHAEGFMSKATGNNSHAEGRKTEASGPQSHAEGSGSKSSGYESHAQGLKTVASGTSSHAQGQEATASGTRSHAEGMSTIASSSASHAEGFGTQAKDQNAHAQGSFTIASANSAHAEGGTTTASGQAAHSQGNGTVASGKFAHAEGGTTTASGRYSHAQGVKTTAASYSQHVFGIRNITDSEGAYVEIVGNGHAKTGDETEDTFSNARTLDWKGNEVLAGSLTTTSIKMKSPDGSLWTLTVNDDGTLTTKKEEA